MTPDPSTTAHGATYSDHVVTTIASALASYEPPLVSERFPADERIAFYETLGHRVASALQAEGFLV